MEISEILARSTNIEQHSPEWHSTRQHTIGGSSIGTILGVGFNSLASFLEGRLLPPPPVSTEAKDNAEIAMNWGTVFEDILAKYVETAYNCRIEGANSFFLGKDEYRGLSYSPDGLSYMDVEYDRYYRETETSIGVVVEHVPVHRRELCLLEFKCPYSRALRGYMPDYYRPQVLMGLEFLGIPRGMFIEAAFRPCYISQFDDTTSHAREFCTRKFAKQYARGAIVVAGEGNIDLSQRPDLLAGAFGDMVRTRDYSTHETPPPPPYKYILCWKLLDIGKFQVDPSPILGALMPKIRSVLEFMEEVKGLPEDEKRRRIAAFCF